MEITSEDWANAQLEPDLQVQLQVKKLLEEVDLFIDEFSD